MNNVVGVLLLIMLAGGQLMAPLAAADVFCDNFKLLSGTLPQNTSSSPWHFATAVSGQAPDVVYVLSVCHGEVVNDSACSGCVSDALNNFLYKLCDESIKAAYRLNGRCTVGFSSHESILLPYNTTTDTGEPFEAWNVKNITGDAGNVRFIAGLIHTLLAETVRSAAANTAWRFATASMESNSNFPMLHAMAWCTPDMSAADCSACQGRLSGMINSTMSIRVGGQMGAMRCYFRYETTKFYDGEPMLSLGGAAPAPAPPPMVPTRETHNRHMNKLWIIPMIVVPLVAASFCFIFRSRWLRRYKGKARLHERQIKNLHGEDEWVWGAEGKNSEFLMFDFDQIMEATGNFSEESKLGQGGFGAVYKGQFSNGVEIAVKRLASHSRQGLVEFKTEIQLIAKLQHRNLVRLLGCCTQGEEKLLVYEYLPNKSLDFFIFDDNNRALLDWHKRLTIVEGIAHGLLYLHKHSRLSVIHRDLKPSNILLDGEMNPKISDFGLARIFNSDNTEGTATRRVVGTYGYMAPEYSSAGIFSTKSDVFSFGVLALEIICGKRNSGSHGCEDFINLLGYAWQIWQEGRWLELIDTSIVPDSHSEEMMKCVNITLLCVQENAADRPTMSDVIAMLSSKTMILAEPKHPGYFNARGGNEEPSTVTKPCSVNYMTISVQSGR